MNGGREHGQLYIDMHFSSEVARKLPNINELGFGEQREDVELYLALGFWTTNPPEEHVTVLRYV